MKVITAPERYVKQPNDILVFLAGGITNCQNWQEDVIAQIERDHTEEETKNLIIFNPRRSKFDMSNPSESVKQIRWEFEALESCDIFSMYFCESESVQPICMYELGRNLVRIQNRFPSNWWYRTIITTEMGYKRRDDVMTQVGLATSGAGNMVRCHNMVEDNKMFHAITIYNRYRALRYQETEDLD